MRRFTYVCADPGIPLPGPKGASVHVENVCRAFVAAGLSGEVYSVRPEGAALDGAPILPIELAPRRKRKSVEERESRLFLGGLNSVIDPDRRTDFIYERYSLWHVRGLARARELEVPFVLEVNSPLPDEAEAYRTLANRPLAEGIARLLLREADGVVCVSETLADWVSSHRGHDEGVWVVPNGVDPKIFTPRPGSRPSPLPPPSVPLIAFCSSFRPWHGIELLGEAFERLVRERIPDAHLICVGDGPRRVAFEERLRQRGLIDRVVLTGHLPQAQVPLWIGGADLAVAPYPQIDGFYFSPLKIFEFLALGLPLVSARIGQIPEVVVHGERGLLCTPGDADELVEAMARLLTSRPEAERLGRAGRTWILEVATWQRRVEEIIDRIERLR